LVIGKLSLYALGILLLLVVLLLKLLPKSLIVFIHFLFLKLFPLKFNLAIEFSTSLLVISLNILLSHDIAKKHLAVKSLNHVLVVMEHLIGLVELSLSKLLLVRLLLGINSSSLDL
jgi:hypothetical protein